VLAGARPQETARTAQIIARFAEGTHRFMFREYGPD